MHKRTIKKIITWIIVLAVIGLAITALVRFGNKPGPLDPFATCISNSGAKFYGAFWCPHCAAEKKLFGKSVKLLPYVECSTPDGQGQTDICKEKGIEGYPTWIFADGSKLSGEIPLADLAAKTSCALPQ
jgi:thiol-disulfide isomerase/thioredoxin